MSKTTNKNSKRMGPEQVFQFNCAPGVSCFTQCCQDVTIVLTPYDVLRMKNGLKIPAEEFIDKYTSVIRKGNRLIPMVVLKMDEETKKCPFVSDKGCAIYEDRPWPCRMFPLDMNDDGTFGIIAEKSLCQGFKEGQKLVISEWLLEQGVPVYDEMIALFSQVTAPLRAEELDIDNPKIFQMTFMALYNLDKFKDFVFNSTFLDRFEVDEVTIEKIKRRDIELLKFAFDWIKFGIFGQKIFQVKPEAMPKEDKVE
ncbi:MAG: YkgJ family cysteine cluster protein [Desulfobacterales bacterium]|nr:YkgJ family cysteine cluster protein [Desulfobacterales bacterium]